MRAKCIKFDTTAMILEMRAIILALLFQLQVSAAFQRPIVIRSNSRPPQASLKMSSDENNLILVIGSANQDLTSNTAVIPTIGETVMVSITDDDCGRLRC